VRKGKRRAALLLPGQVPHVSPFIVRNRPAVTTLLPLNAAVYGPHINTVLSSRQPRSWVLAQGGCAVIGQGQDLLAPVGSLWDAATDTSMWGVAL
jgi:hypothetical protein